MRRILFFLLLVASFFVELNAQDARLSQIWSLPSMMNPALIGQSDDQVLSGLGYSNQKTKSSQVVHQYAFLNGRFARDYDKTGKAFALGGTFYQYGSGNAIFDKEHTRRSARFRCSFTHEWRTILRPASITTNIQTDFDGSRL